MISTGYRDNWNYGRHDQRHAPYFGTAVNTASIKAVGGKALVKSGEEILNLGVAQKLYKFFGNGGWTRDPRIGGLSMEDVAARLLNLVAITVPQGVVAIKTNTSPWERNAQNVLSLGLGIGMSMLFKHDKFGFNSLFDPFMKPLPPDAGKFRKLFSPLYAKKNYFDILKAAGVEFKPKDRQRAFWAVMDGNQRALVDALHHKLSAKKAQGVLKQSEKALLDALPRFRAQLILLPFLSAGLITMATVYVLGYVTTKFVFKVFVPLDEQRERDAEKQAKQGDKMPSPRPVQQKAFGALYPPAYHMPWPSGFQSFATTRPYSPLPANSLTGDASHVAH